MPAEVILEGGHPWQWSLKTGGFPPNLIRGAVQILPCCPSPSSCLSWITVFHVRRPILASPLNLQKHHQNTFSLWCFHCLCTVPGCSGARVSRWPTAEWHGAAWTPAIAHLCGDKDEDRASGYGLSWDQLSPQWECKWLKYCCWPEWSAPWGWQSWEWQLLKLPTRNWVCRESAVMTWHRHT